MIARLLGLAFVFLACLHPCRARAQEFAAIVSPPRFEISGKAGKTLRQVIEITNRSNAPARFRVHTSDFVLGADYGLTFHDELLKDSCRPWVAIERPLVTLPAGGTIRYRFEVQVPQDAPDGECRFAIMIEGDEPSVTKAGAVQLPIVGRIGVIVYVTVGAAAPQIEFFGPKVITFDGRQVPALRVHNSGTAHTRMSGFLSGTDATGRKFDFTPSDLPVLPGEDREVALTPSTSDNPAPTLTFPVAVRGTLEWSDQRTELDEHFK
jgi:P pilus assembly chaperone PapD